MPTEQAFHGNPTGRGHDIGIVAQLGSIRSPSSQNPEEEIQLELTAGHVLVLVLVLGAPYAAWLQHAAPSLASIHGRLCPPGPCDGPLHAIVLTGRWRDGYYFLDPYFPAESQPLTITDDQFVRCFAGVARIADE